jgi:glyceraldehyde-3-phosphate dehydrogenase/erythrose-4-phosphate dehydrogenase
MRVGIDGWPSACGCTDPQDLVHRVVTAPAAARLVAVAEGQIALDGTFVKIVSWYDNEWGYSTKCLEIVEVVAGK